MRINLTDQIVIIDEAHNIEDSCRESTNSLITKIQLVKSIEELSVASRCLAGEMKEAAAYFCNIVSD